MNISLDSYEITKAIKMYLKARGVNWEDEYLEMHIDDEGREIINLEPYKYDMHYDKKKQKWITTAKYQVEGVFVRRIRKYNNNNIKNNKYEYVRLASNTIRTDIGINEESNAKLTVYEEM